MSVENRMKVAVRCRPIVGIETNADPYKFLTCDSEQKQIELDKKLFNYDYVFDSTATQADVYDVAVTKLTEKFLSGSNAAIIAYGQTGSGKTHTMGMNDEDAGIIPRTLRQIFESTDAKTIDETNVKVSFLEVYNEDVYDLLKEGRPKISSREDVHSVKAKEIPVQSYRDAMVCLLDGVGIRTTGATAMNTVSSRSHTIFSVVLETMNETKRRQMMLVDLAGSEQAKKTKTVGNRFKEGVNINKGLFALGSVVNALSRDKGSGHIPYRDSTLTKLLKNCLEGNSEIMMIVCISPLEESVQETTNSLKFAERALAVEMRPNVPSRFSDSSSGRKKASRIQSLTPFSASRQQRPHLGTISKLPPIPVFNLDSSPAVSADEPQFKKPKTPDQVSVSSIPRALFSPLVRNICSTIETSMDRVADRLVLGSRNVVNTPVRESIIDAVMHRITITRLGFVPPRLSSTRLDGVLNRSNEGVSSKSNLTMDDSVMEQTVLLRRSPRPSKRSMDSSRAEKCGLLRRSSRPSKRSKENESNRTVDGSIMDESVRSRRSSRHSTCSTIKSSKGRDVMLNVDQSVLMTSSRQDVHTANILDVLNKASAKELQHLPCVGPKSAIVLHNWRMTNGLFRNMKDIRSIPGLPRSFYGRFIEANSCDGD